MQFQQQIQQHEHKHEILSMLTSDMKYYIL